MKSFSLINFCTAHTWKCYFGHIALNKTDDN